MALGRGLSALITEKNESDPASSTGLEVSIALIKDNRFQPRLTYDVVKIDELAVSIKEKGLLQPIVVRKSGDGFEVIAGERRLKAARKLGLEKVPVVIRNVDDKEALVLALIENIQREELNPIEEAQSFRRLIDEFKNTQEDVARMVSKDRATVANLIRLLKLPNDIQKAVADGKISSGHARAILSVSDESSQMILFAEIIQKGLSVREAEEKAKTGIDRDKVISKIIKNTLKDPEVATLEEELRQIFGTKVEIQNKRGNKGRLVIEYYSLNDFDRILEVVRK
ncbi:MAG: ParB/RepB/Spo0J family partition protein [Candidatus Omnitrophota bacterium]